MSLWYALLRKYVSLGLKLYFREIRIVGAENIPTDGPVMFTVNHQNAFLDALLVATSNRRHTHFLVRADVFKFLLMRKFFSTLNMMPVYRIRDGTNSLVNNHEIFDRCIKILEKDHALMLFPEANHHQKRFLLPLSKGFTRIALGVEDPIVIIPVGINYTHHRYFGASVSLCFGRPISTGRYKNGSAVNNRELRQLVNDRMQNLITSIPDNPHYQKYEDYLNRDRHQYMDPDRCNRWIAKTDAKTIQVENSDESPGVLRIMVKVIASVFNFLPIGFNFLLLNKLNDPVFSSSVKLLSGIIILPLYYLLLALVLFLVGGPVFTAIILALAVLSLIARKYSLPFRSP